MNEDESVQFSLHKCLLLILGLPCKLILISKPVKWSFEPFIVERKSDFVLMPTVHMPSDVCDTGIDYISRCSH